ncbi:MAG: hypothetical protein LBT46_08575 [Planctomycetaceae bacterium]|nr:hypothetical protein [Planctomycetaceae bacterium]
MTNPAQYQGDLIDLSSLWGYKIRCSSNAAPERATIIVPIMVAPKIPKVWDIP